MFGRRKPQRQPNDEDFDWSAEEHATKHGFSIFEIEDAFDDPHELTNTQVKSRNRDVSYDEDERYAMLAQSQPNGPLLHIVYVHSDDGRIRVFHCREMNSQEARFYRAKKRR